MKTKLILMVTMLIAFTSVNLFAQKTKDIISIYPGSHVAYDDDLGYDEFYVCTGKTSDDKIKIDTIEGYIHHRFCYFPKGCSCLQIIRNYEEVISKYGGSVLHSANTKECIKSFLKKGNPNRTSRNFEYQFFRDQAFKYFSAKIPSDTLDYYVMIVIANCAGKPVYSLVTVKTKPMEMGMISVENIHDGMSTKGHIAVYDILFDTGKSEIMDESADALKNIAEYLNAHSDKKYFIVGHTDNVGDFEANIKLSTERANAVVNELIIKYSVKKEQLKPYGVGPVSPVALNSTDKGKAKNRRVEIVEQ
ncbi:MAG: OmpA family protein [Bacteroidales bacterium]|nr:OmpA family protein [Bacteroidales bacterium]